MGVCPPAPGTNQHVGDASHTDNSAPSLIASVSVSVVVLLREFIAIAALRIPVFFSFYRLDLFMTGGGEGRPRKTSLWHLLALGFRSVAVAGPTRVCPACSGFLFSSNDNGSAPPPRWRHVRCSRLSTSRPRPGASARRRRRRRTLTGLTSHEKLPGVPLTLRNEQYLKLVFSEKSFVIQKLFFVR